MKRLLKILILILVIVVICFSIYFYSTFSKKENYNTYYAVQATCSTNKNQTYQLYLPIPVTVNGSPIFNMSNYQFKGQVNNVEIVKTLHGIALKLNATGDVFLVLESHSLEDYEKSENSKLSMWENYSSSTDYIVGKVWIKLEGEHPDVMINIIYGHKDNYFGRNIMEYSVISTLSSGWNTYEVDKRAPPQPCNST